MNKATALVAPREEDPWWESLWCSTCLSRVGARGVFVGTGPARFAVAFCWPCALRVRDLIDLEVGR